MEKPYHIAFLLVLAVVAGCTPPSDNLLKKNSVDFGAAELSSSSTDARSGNLAEAAPDPQTRIILESYGSTIKTYADRYGLDWKLVLAVMKQESGFSPDAESEKGARGLMQMMPFTSEEVGRILEIEDMAHPMNNIKGGVYYLARLYNLFEGVEEADRIRLTLAAYNAGAGRVFDAQDLAAYFAEDPRKWQAVRDALPLLSKRYYTLHRNVWSEERPRAGWFGDSRQTITYVDRVMENYERYQDVLN
jgi:membrane-bound lytic murein transglycosylase F